MAKHEKPTGNPPLPSDAQEDQLLSTQIWATFRKLQPEYREVIKKLAACKGTPLKTFYEDILNKSMRKLSEYRIGKPRKSPVGAEYIQVGYANIGGLLLSRLKDKKRWRRFQDTLLRQHLREYWAREFLDNAVSNQGLNWLVRVSGFGLPVAMILFDSDRRDPKKDRELIRLVQHAKKFIGHQLGNDQRDKYIAIARALRENRKSAEPRKESQVIYNLVKTDTSIFLPNDDPFKLRKSFDLYVKRHPKFLSSIR
jgi:hypothetical protein